MSNTELLAKISNELKIELNPDDIKLIKINKTMKVYEIPKKSIKILFLRKSGTIMINSIQRKNKLA